MIHAFHRMAHFIKLVEFMEMKLFSYYPFNVCSDTPSHIPDIGHLCFLISFFLPNLTKGILVLCCSITG